MCKTYHGVVQLEKDPLQIEKEWKRRKKERNASNGKREILVLWGKT